MELFSELPLSCIVLCTVPLSLCSALPLWGTVFFTAFLGHCAFVLPFWGTVLRTALVGWVVGDLGSKPVIFSAVAAALPRYVVFLSFQESPTDTVVFCYASQCLLHRRIQYHFDFPATQESKFCSGKTLFFCQHLSVLSKYSQYFLITNFTL